MPLLSKTPTFQDLKGVTKVRGISVEILLNQNCLLLDKYFQHILKWTTLRYKGVLRCLYFWTREHTDRLTGTLEGVERSKRY